MCQPALRVYAIELAGLNEWIANGSGLAAFFLAQEQIVLSANGNGAHGALCGVVIPTPKSHAPDRASPSGYALRHSGSHPKMAI